MWPFKQAPKQPTPKMIKAIREFRAHQKWGYRTDLEGAVYHGGCIGCLYLKGNDTRAGIEWCLGCLYSNFNQSLPDLSIDLNDER